MADGYVHIEYNTEGEARIQTVDGVKEVTFLDFRLEGLDIEHYGLLEEMTAQLPQDLKDVLVLASFKYECIASHHMEGTDYEDSYPLESYLILKTDYKEHYRLLVTEELKLKDVQPGLDDERYFTNLIDDWEEFYNEDFKPFKKKVVDKQSFFN